MKAVYSLITGLLLAAVVSDSTAADFKEALIFYAPFDGGVDAKTAGGDPKLYSAPQIKFPPEAHAGLPSSGYVTHEKAKGKFGDCLRFHRKSSEMVFFHAKNNFPYKEKQMQGTVSFWLKGNPDEELEPGYADPIQITSKGWDNAAFFVEFSKDETPREFRLGIYPDFSVWNPHKRDWNSIPFSEKPLLPVIRPPFSKEQWTHIVFTFDRFNSGQPDGEARLYLNGKSQGSLAPREQTFTWDLEKALIMLGLSYVGYFDELAIFDRALTESEIARLYSSASPLR